MKKLIYKDKKKRNIVANFNYFKFILKSIIYNKNIYFTVRFNAFYKLILLNKNTSKVTCVNRCVITGRKAGISKKFRLSRLTLLRVFRFGQVSGIRKIVW